MSTEDASDSPSLSPYAGIAKRIRPEGSAAMREFLETPPRLILVRGKEEVQVHLSLRPSDLAANVVAFATRGAAQFAIELDGKEVGRLARGQRWEESIEEGEHQLRLNSGIRKSSVIRFSAGAGECFRFVCSTSLVSLILRRVY